MRKSGIFLFALITALSSLSFAHPCVAEEDYTDVVKAEAIADVLAIAPGDQFQLGVKFVMKAGWHVYWLNPGDSGLPTSVMPTLPDGFTASPLQWPVPIRFVQPGNIRGFGYEGETLLYFKVSAPVTLAVGSQVTIPLTVKWLACSHVCVPGRSELVATLPVGSKSDGANHDIFEKYEQLLPRTQVSEVKVAASAFKQRVEGMTTFTDYELAFDTAKDLGQFGVLVGHDRSLSSTEPSITKEGLRVLVRFTVKPVPGRAKSSGAFPVLLVSSGAAQASFPALSEQVPYPS